MGFFVQYKETMISSRNHFFLIVMHGLNSKLFQPYNLQGFIKMHKHTSF